MIIKLIILSQKKIPHKDTTNTGFYGKEKSLFEILINDAYPPGKKRMIMRKAYQR